MSRLSALIARYQADAEPWLLPVILAEGITALLVSLALQLVGLEGHRPALYAAGSVLGVVIVLCNLVLAAALYAAALVVTHQASGRRRVDRAASARQRDDHRRLEATMDALGADQLEEASLVTGMDECWVCYARRGEPHRCYDHDAVERRLRDTYGRGVWS